MTYHPRHNITCPNIKETFSPGWTKSLLYCLELTRHDLSECQRTQPDTQGTPLKGKYERTRRFVKNLNYWRQSAINKLLPIPPFSRKQKAAQPQRSGQQSMRRQQHRKSHYWCSQRVWTDGSKPRRIQMPPRRQRSIPPQLIILIDKRSGILNCRRQLKFTGSSGVLRRHGLRAQEHQAAIDDMTSLSLSNLSISNPFLLELLKSSTHVFFPKFKLYNDILKG